MWLSIFFLLSTAPSARLQRPEVVVRQLYSYVVVHHPLGIPVREDRSALWPLLSNRLVRQLETASACENDYRRQHRPEEGKPAFGWLETGIFSGSDEQALPNKVTIEKTERRNGTARVYLRLAYRETSATHGRSPASPEGFEWRVAAIVKSERGRFVIDDILIFKTNSPRIDARLSKMFEGCNGPRWVGDGGT
jgi:hypothetical protein